MEDRSLYVANDISRLRKVENKRTASLIGEVVGVSVIFCSTLESGKLEHILTCSRGNSGCLIGKTRTHCIVLRAPVVLAYWWEEASVGPLQ